GNGAAWPIPSLVVCGRLFELGIPDQIVLNPKLSVGLLQKRFDGDAGRDGLVRIEFGGGDKLALPLLRVMIQIAAEHYWPGLRELQKQDLMAGRMAGRGLNDDALIAKHVVVGGCDEHRLAVL